jgi:hypothetical protein
MMDWLLVISWWCINYSDYLASKDDTGWSNGMYLDYEVHMYCSRVVPQSLPAETQEKHAKTYSVPTVIQNGQPTQNNQKD